MIPADFLIPVKTHNPVANGEHHEVRFNPNKYFRSYKIYGYSTYSFELVYALPRRIGFKYSWCYSGAMFYV